MRGIPCQQVLATVFSGCFVFLSLTAWSAGKDATEEKGKPGFVPGLPDQMSLDVEPHRDEFQIEQLPPGIALTMAFEPFREQSELLQNDDAVVKFAQHFDCDGYANARQDEFKHREFAKKWRENIRVSLDHPPDPKGYRMTIPVAMEFGEYDFERGGFPIENVSKRIRLANVSDAGCMETCYGVCDRTHISERIYGRLLMPSSWTPIVKVPESEAHKVVEAARSSGSDMMIGESRIFTGSVAVEVVEAGRAEGELGYDLQVRPVGPFTVRPNPHSSVEWELQPPDAPRLD